MLASRRQCLAYRPSTNLTERQSLRDGYVSILGSIYNLCLVHTTMPDNKSLPESALGTSSLHCIFDGEIYRMESMLFLMGGK